MEVVNNLLLDKKEYDQVINDTNYLITKYTIIDQAQLIITTQEENPLIVNARLVDLQEDNRKYGVIRLVNEDNDYYLEYEFKSSSIDVSDLNDLTLELSREQKMMEALLTVLINHNVRIKKKELCNE